MQSPAKKANKENKVFLAKINKGGLMALCICKRVLTLEEMDKVKNPSGLCHKCKKIGELHIKNEFHPTFSDIEKQNKNV